MRWQLQPLARLHAAIAYLQRNPVSTVTLQTDQRDWHGDLARDFAALMAEVRKRKAEIDAVIQASPLGFFRTGSDGLITFANEAYLRNHGLAREDSAQGWLRLVRPDIRDQVWQGWQQAVSR